MVDFPYSITGLWRLTQLLCLHLRHSILQKRYSRSENTEEKWKPSNLTGSLITAEPPFSSCTSSVIDFWHYKTSFTTILSNFCQVQPGTIHNPADLTKKDINSGSTIQTQDALQPPRGLPPAPWAEAPTPQVGLSSGTQRSASQGCATYHRPTHNVSFVHSCRFFFPEFL